MNSSEYEIVDAVIQRYCHSLQQRSSIEYIGSSPEDLSQDIWESLLEKMESYDPARSGLVTFTYVVCNSVLSHKRTIAGAQKRENRNLHNSLDERISNHDLSNGEGGHIGQVLHQNHRRIDPIWKNITLGNDDASKIEYNSLVSFLRDSLPDRNVSKKIGVKYLEIFDLLMEGFSIVEICEIIRERTGRKLSPWGASLLVQKVRDAAREAYVLTV